MVLRSYTSIGDVIALFIILPILVKTHIHNNTIIFSITIIVTIIIIIIVIIIMLSIFTR